MPDNQSFGQLRIARRSKGQRGQAIVMVTFGIFFLLGILGLVVDVGWGYYRKQVAQAAADSAAMAAVVAAGTGTITCGSGGVVCPASGPISCTAATTGSNLLTGCEYGAKNGIPNSEMTINAGTTSAPGGVTVNYWVTATVAESMTPTFLRMIGVTGATVGTSASAAVVSTGSAGGGGGCLYVLDNSASQALYLNGANMISTCGVYVNSANTVSAFQLNSANAWLTTSAGLTMVTAAKIDCSGCGCKTDSFYGSQNPSNTTQCTDPSYAAPAADPLSAVPAPSYSGCNYTNYSWSNMSPPQTLSPGVYCGGINIQGGNVTFSPGTYVLNGGGLKIQGANTTVAGANVFFYNTANGYTAGELLVSGQPTVTMTPPASGPYEGLLFMQDHGVCPSTSHAFQGNSNVNTSGTIYLHCTNTGGSYVGQNILYTGESTGGYYSALVVDTIQINGMSNLRLDPTGGKNTGIGLSGGVTNTTYMIQ